MDIGALLDEHQDQVLDSVGGVRQDVEQIKTQLRQLATSSTGWKEMTHRQLAQITNLLSGLPDGNAPFAVSENGGKPMTRDEILYMLGNRVNGLRDRTVNFNFTSAESGKEVPNRSLTGTCSDGLAGSRTISPGC